MGDDRRETALDALYGAPLEAFVDERTRLARDLRAAGDRDAATALGKVAKPSAAAWALNHVARERPEAVADWLAATSALRDAVPEGGAALREAMAAQRSATAELVTTVRDHARPNERPLSAAMVERVRALLQQASADGELTERVRAGRVVEPPAAAAPTGATADGRTERAAGSERGGGTTAERAARGQRGDDESSARATRGGTTAKRAARGSDAAPEARDETTRAPTAEGDEQRAARRARERRERAGAQQRAKLERAVEHATRELERLRADAAERAQAARDADARLQDARRSLRELERSAADAREAANHANRATSAAERELERRQAELRRAADATVD